MLEPCNYAWILSKERERPVSLGSSVATCLGALPENSMGFPWRVPGRLSVGKFLTCQPCLHEKTLDTLVCRTIHGNNLHSHVSHMGDYGRLHKKQCAAMHYAKPDITTLSSNAAHDTHAWEKSHESCAVPYWTLN